MAEEKEITRFDFDAVVEANDELQREVLRLRNSNRILRTVHRALRSRLESLERQIELAQFNDDVFKRFCNGEFDAKVEATADAGLAEAEGSVEPADA